ncbi:MAG: transglycosylase domain-containing protein [Proteobacteria bacterium]|nr:transglycosylase domain-containing protein [Pseudomonadota bacterium]
MRGRRIFTKRPVLSCCLLLFLLSIAATGWLIKRTWEELRPFQATLLPQDLTFRKHQFLDRNGIPLSVTFDNPWNVHDWLPLHEIPTLLQEAFIASEDRRFYRHHGVDWLARAHALMQNILALRGVRGASTITEQVVRILHPRPRTLWSRWLEGFEAASLEEHFSKAEIFEFYLNQVPYSRQRRGVLQAARLHFDRDPGTLTAAETLTLAVLVRAPGRLSLKQGAGDLTKSVQRLGDFLIREGKLGANEREELTLTNLHLTELHLPVEAGHFIRQLTHHEFPQQSLPTSEIWSTTGSPRVLTTLDSVLQGQVQDILDQHMHDLKHLDVHNGAALAVDHQTDEVLVWVNSSVIKNENSGGWIDCVTSPRQPGSTLKPFLYGLALDRGWTPATIIDDSPLARPVGDGMHPFRNYSRKHYGPLRLREALGNSLNIPAIRTIQFTGVEDFLDLLHNMGIAGLDRTAGHYGEGLALGNGEVTLLELVQGYTILARGGVVHPLRFTLSGKNYGPTRHRLFSHEAASLIADILSDPQARRLEFGSGNILRFPVQTAVKTGTSNDHRDAWAVGFNHRYTVGIWMGNLDGHSTGGLTGITGPGLILRSVFSELNRFEEAQPLSTSQRLGVARICSNTGQLAGPFCQSIVEKFMLDTMPLTVCTQHGAADSKVTVAGAAQAKIGTTVHIIQPAPNLQMAMDPHIPDSIEAYPMKISGGHAATRVEWSVDGQLAGITGENDRHFMWPLTRGSHQAQARVWQGKGDLPLLTPEVRFVVK